MNSEEELIKKLREEISFYKENDNKYVIVKLNNGENSRKFIDYNEHIMKILRLEVEQYAKDFEENDDKKNIITYILFEIYSLIEFPMLLSFDKFIKYLNKNRTNIEDNEDIMSKLSICYKLLDNNRIIDKKDILSFLSEGYKNYAENDNKTDIYISVLPQNSVIKIVENDEIIDEIDSILRYLIYTKNEKNTTYKKQKLNLKMLAEDEEKTLTL